MLMGTNSITTAEGTLYERKLFVHHQDGHLLWQAGSPVVHRKRYSQLGTTNRHRQTQPQIVVCLHNPHQLQFYKSLLTLSLSHFIDL